MTKNIADSILSKAGSQAMGATTQYALAALLAGGHILLTGPTGIGKTKWAREFAGAIGVGMSRVRCTEDALPHEVFGTQLQEHGSQGGWGPLYTRVFQCDEVGNAHTAVHTALMEAVEPGRHSTGPFFVIATDTDTYTLPETLTDRFMMKLTLGYPGVAAEKQILQMYNENTHEDPQPACSLQDISLARQEVQAVRVEEAIFNYIVSIVETTRRVGAVMTGASPRGSIALMLAAKAQAAIMGRDYVIADDVRALAVPVLRHRIKLKRDALQEGIQPERVIEGIIAGK